MELGLLHIDQGRLEEAEKQLLSAKSVPPSSDAVSIALCAATCSKFTEPVGKACWCPNMSVLNYVLKNIFY